MSFLVIGVKGVDMLCYKDLTDEQVEIMPEWSWKMFSPYRN